MRRIQQGLIVLLIVMFAAGPARAQQQHIVSPGTIDEAVAQHAQDSVAKRETVRTALQHADVQRVAERLGLEIARAEAAVSTLDGIELDRIASQAQVVNDALAGGQTVTLNLLWVIIGLLILVLIIAAAN
jgi:hypothetical protein